MIRWNIFDLLTVVLKTKLLTKMLMIWSMFIITITVNTVSKNVGLWLLKAILNEQIVDLQLKIIIIETVSRIR